MTDEASGMYDAMKRQHEYLERTHPRPLAESVRDAAVRIQCGRCKQDWGEGHVCPVTEPAWMQGLVADDPYYRTVVDGWPIETFMSDFIGKRVRVTVEVLD